MDSGRYDSGLQLVCQMHYNFFEKQKKDENIKNILKRNLFLKFLVISYCFVSLWHFKYCFWISFSEDLLFTF